MAFGQSVLCTLIPSLMVTNPNTLSPGIGLQQGDNLYSNLLCSVPKTNKSNFLLLSFFVTFSSVVLGFLLMVFLKKLTKVLLF
jgi:hypothetical protein